MKKSRVRLIQGVAYKHSMIILGMDGIFLEIVDVWKCNFRKTTPMYNQA
jgi:hypothetical protein